MFSIKAVSQTSGVSIETLRAWERRYGIVTPQRDSNGRRSYAPEDVIRLRKLREATERGHAISKLARLSDDDIGKLLADTPARTGAVTTRSFAEQMLQAALEYRPDDCDQALSMAFALLPLRTVVNEVLTPVLHEIGERWHAGTARIAQEHIVTGTVRKQVGAVIDTSNRIASGPTVVLATVAGEHHEMGILMGALLASSRGARCYYLGPDVPAEDIVIYTERTGAAALALSFVHGEVVAESVAELTQIARDLPAAIEMWAGGAATRLFDSHKLPDRVRLLEDFAAFENQVDLLVGSSGRRQAS